MTPEQFVKEYLDDAILCEKKTGFPHVATLAQGAQESGWGKFAVGNMFFGVKDTDGVNGNEQLITTTEYSRYSDRTPKQLGLVSITKIVPVTLKGQRYYKYTGKAYFRKFATPEESFTHHANFILKNKRYKAAIGLTDPFKFIDAIAAAGYATDPNYAANLKAVARSIIKRLPK